MEPLRPFESYLIHEFVEDYHDGLMSRRDMVRRVLHITGGVASAATVLTALGVSARPGEAAAQATPGPTGPRSPLSVPPDDPRVIAEEISFPSGHATIMTYQARPSGMDGTPVPGASPAASPSATSALPVVLICHENRGLTEHIKDVARRWAVEGYLACAVDLLSREGGTSGVADPTEIPAILTRGDDPAARHVADFQAAVEHYRDQEIADVNRLGMTGFCFGGGVTWRAATAMPELRAAAPYYGPPPPLDQVPNIEAAVIAVYSDDPGDFANEGREELKAALEAAGIIHEFHVYPNTQHAFNNDTGQRYNEEQALNAWRDVTAWFEQYVKGA